MASVIKAIAAGTPPPTLGQEGDLFTDGFENKLYGPKTKDGWVQIIAALNITATQITSTAISQTRFSVTGYTVGGDGGGGAVYVAGSASGLGARQDATGAWYQLDPRAPGFSPTWLGAGLGAANDTTAVQAFLTALRDGGAGDWGNRTYPVDEGVLILQPTSIAGDTKGPIIEGTANFVARGTADAPILRVWNPTLTGSPGSFYTHGDIGLVTFRDEFPSATTARHGLSIRGLLHWNLRAIGTNLRGAILHLPLFTVGGNTDFYESASNDLRLEGSRCLERVIFDEIGIGGSLGTVNSLVVHDEYISAATNNGAYTGGGQGVAINNVSVGGTKGWAVNFKLVQASANRQSGRTWEIDGTENGLWFGAGYDASFQHLRFNSRFQTQLGVSWPRTFIKIGGDAGIVRKLKISANIRTNPGDTLASLGTLIDCSNDPNITDVIVDIFILDNAVTGYANQAPTTLVANLVDGAVIKVIVNGVTIVDQRNVAAARVRAPTATVAIPTSGYLGTGFKTTGWSNIPFDPSLIWDATNNWFLIKSGGYYTMRCSVLVPVGAGAGQIPVGGLIRTAIVKDTAGALTLQASDYRLAQDASGVTSVNLEATGKLNYGERIWLGMVAVPNSGTAFLTAIGDINGDNIFQIERYDAGQ